MRAIKKIKQSKGIKVTSVGSEAILCRLLGIYISSEDFILTDKWSYYWLWAKDRYDLASVLKIIILTTGEGYRDARKDLGQRTLQ